jgi:ATP-dependent exoDNAse (exonuclease V) beta subunit
VRRNSEGQEIADYLLQYKKSAKALPDCRYDVVSNESLRLEGAATVNLLLGAMRYLLNSEDPIARAQLSYEYARLHKPDRKPVEVFAVTNQVFFESQLPEGFVREKIALKKLPLFELTETLIQIFDVGGVQGELAYLQAFQDLVLEFYGRERNDLASFLEWWEDNKESDKTSIKVSGEVNAVKILTLHKAKGLQFRYVLIPLCSWSYDHGANLAPTLWVKSDDAPFANAGYLPVDYSSKLKETYFKEAYHTERISAFLDNLNLLYVAFTRAEHGMIISAPHPKNNFGKTTVASWVFDSIQSNPELATGWNEAEQKFTLGEFIVSEKEHKEQSAPAEELREYASHRWRDKLVIRQAGPSFFDEVTTDKRTKINYGIHLHAVLSRIHDAKDVYTVVERLVQEGYILTGEKAAIQEQLETLLQHPVVGRWFATEWKVRTEVPILLPGGAENRIDRLLTNNDKAIVVDFKTGEKSTADQKQVQEYMDILHQMNFKEVEGYLLYTRDQEVIAVHKNKSKKVKEKDESQLGLF